MEHTTNSEEMIHRATQIRSEETVEKNNPATSVCGGFLGTAVNHPVTAAAPQYFFLAGFIE